MWIGDDYFYSPGWLKTIAGNYGNIYTCIKSDKTDQRYNPATHGYYSVDVSRLLVTDMDSLVEYKVDYDMARKAVGRNYRKMAKYLNGEME